MPLNGTKNPSTDFRSVNLFFVPLVLNPLISNQFVSSEENVGTQGRDVNLDTSRCTV